MSGVSAKMAAVEAKLRRPDAPREIRPGDSVRVHYKIVEGDKERVQVFAGVVIRIHRAGTRSTVTVRKVSSGIGVERIFPLHSPRLEKITVTASARVRRSRLYYLRGLAGKAARLRNRRRPAAALVVAAGAETPEEGSGDKSADGGTG